MIKARLGTNLLIIGLSEENVKRLKDGKDILTTLDELGLKGMKLLVTHGKTAEAIASRLQADVMKARNQQN